MVNNLKTVNELMAAAKKKYKDGNSIIEPISCRASFAKRDTCRVDHHPAETASLLYYCFFQRFLESAVGQTQQNFPQLNFHDIACII